MSSNIHPDPPPDLATRPLTVVPQHGPWARAYRLDYPPEYFGRGGTERFDDPAKAFGVCYFGDGEPCAFIETLPTTLELPDRRLLVVRAEALAARGWAAIELVDPRDALRLINLTGGGLARIGADNDLCSCRDYAVPQRWSAALHAHGANADGILYRARHDPSLTSVALFDRARDKIAMTPRGAWDAAENRSLLKSIVAAYDVSILPADS